MCVAEKKREHTRLDVAGSGSDTSPNFLNVGRSPRFEKRRQKRKEREKVLRQELEKYDTEIAKNFTAEGKKIFKEDYEVPGYSGHGLLQNSPSNSSEDSEEEDSPAKNTNRRDSSVELSKSKKLQNLKKIFKVEDPDKIFEERLLPEEANDKFKPENVESADEVGIVEEKAFYLDEDSSVKNESSQSGKKSSERDACEDKQRGHLEITSGSSTGVGYSSATTAGIADPMKPVGCARLNDSASSNASSGSIIKLNEIERSVLDLAASDVVSSSLSDYNAMALPEDVMVEIVSSQGSEEVMSAGEVQEIPKPAG